LAGIESHASHSLFFSSIPISPSWSVFHDTSIKHVPIPAPCCKIHPTYWGLSLGIPRPMADGLHLHCIMRPGLDQNAKWAPVRFRHGSLPWPISFFLHLSQSPSHPSRFSSSHNKAHGRWSGPTLHYPLETNVGTRSIRAWVFNCASLFLSSLAPGNFNCTDQGWILSTQYEC
jgi:hypothetical protein